MSTQTALRYYFTGSLNNCDFEYFEVEITNQDDLNFYVRIEYLDYIVENKAVNKDEIERIKKLIA